MCSDDVLQKIKKSVSYNTSKKHQFYFKKFEDWCNINEVPSLPSKACVIAVFLSGKIQGGVSESVLLAYFHSIKWFHDVHCSYNPCDEKLIHMLIQGGRRMLAKPVQKKEPITVEILKNIHNSFGLDKNKHDLKSVRLFCMLIVGYGGFLKFPI